MADDWFVKSIYRSGEVRGNDSQMHEVGLNGCKKTMMSGTCPHARFMATTTATGIGFWEESKIQINL